MNTWKLICDFEEWYYGEEKFVQPDGEIVDCYTGRFGDKEHARHFYEQGYFLVKMLCELGEFEFTNCEDRDILLAESFTRHAEGFQFLEGPNYAGWHDRCECYQAFREGAGQADYDINA